MKLLKNKFVASAVLICVLLFVGSYIYQSDLLLEPVKPHGIVNIEEISFINKNQQRDLLAPDDTKVILYFQISDFTCTACIQHFLYYSDNFSENVERWNDQVVFLTTRNEMPLSQQRERVKVWASANYINDEIEILISEDFQDNFNIQKSAVLVSAERNNFQFFYFPLKASERMYIDSKLNL